MLSLDGASDVSAAGSKAQTLARARRQGLPVLDGVVFLAGEAVDGAELAAALERLGGARFVVRSSATLEDLPGASAAGVYRSLTGVAKAEVAAAIAEVRASAGRPEVEAYLAARGVASAGLRMAVLVQPMAEAARLGVVHSAPVPADEGAGDRPRRLCAEERAAGEPEFGAVTARRLELDDPIARLARAAADLLGGEALCEYALTADGPVLLQARPLSIPPLAAPDPSLWRLDDQAGAHAFALDAEHNPAPLSAAQAGLVERAGRGEGPGGLRVLHGWLYARVADGGAATPEAPDEAPRALLEGRIAPRAAALLAPLEALTEPPLEAALRVFDEVTRLHGAELGPVLTRARAALDRFLATHLGESLAAHAGLLAGSGGRTLARDQSLWELGRAGAAEQAARLATHLAEHGAYAPAWDVAAATDDEDEARVLASARLLARGPAPAARHPEAVARADGEAHALAARLEAGERGALLALVQRAREAVTVGEDDDALYFRAQRLVRRALLALGRRAVLAGHLDDAGQIFELPLDEAAALPAAPPGAGGRARAARALRLARSRLRPPSRIEAGHPTWRGGATGALRGVGTSGRARGRVLVVRDPSALDAAAAAGAVVVADAVLPSMTFLLGAAAALVTDEGGALSHGATLAREYGLPAVLGTGRATATLRDGEEVLVDADQGRVFRLSRED